MAHGGGAADLSGASGRVAAEIGLLQSGRGSLQWQCGSGIGSGSGSRCGTGSGSAAQAAAQAAAVRQ